MNVRAVGRLLMDVVALALIALALVMLSGRMTVQPVLSGSMTGYAGRGDWWSGSTPDDAEGRRRHPVRAAGPVRDPRQSPGRAPDPQHRPSSTAPPVATTQGDANPQPDPWTLDLAHTRTAQVQLVLAARGVALPSGWTC